MRKATNKFYEKNFMEANFQTTESSPQSSNFKEKFLCENHWTYFLSKY